MKKSLLILLGGAIVISTFAFESSPGIAADLPSEKNIVFTSKVLKSNYKHKTDITGIRTIELEAEDLKVLGIRVANGNIYQSLPHGGYVCYSKSGNSFPEIDKNNRNILVVQKPVLVTDDLGTWRSYKCQDIGKNEVLKKNSVCIDESIVDSKLNMLVPILVRSGEEYTFMDKMMGNWRPDVIFWYENTDQIQDLLQADW